MALLTVRTFPDPILKQVAKPVQQFDDALKHLTENMLETMYDSKGIGLAANQVGVLKRVVVMDIYSGEEDTSLRDPQVYINPIIIENSGEVCTEEGCLSVPEYVADVKRAEKIIVSYQDVEGKKHTVEANELKAVCFQHELDHLNGILFIDHLSLLKQKMVKKKLTKLAKRSA